MPIRNEGLGAGRGNSRPASAPRDRPALVTAFRRFPVTTLILMPYALLILPQAVLFRNESTTFILRVMAIALVPAFVLELLFNTSRSAPPETESRREYSGRLYTIAKVMIAVGAVSGVISASMGVGTVFSQVGNTAVSSVLATTLTMFRSWVPAGLGLLFASHLRVLCTKGQMGRWLLVAIGAQAVESYFTAITAPLMAMVVFTVTVMLYLGLISIRQCLAVALVVIVAWPTVFTLRNEVRSAGGVAVSSRVGPFDRLRYDLQVSRAEGLGTRIDVDTPDAAEMLKYGLIPRALDPGRPPLSTGARINVYLGGDATSSFSFLPVTTLYVLEGGIVVALFYSAWAILLMRLMRNRTRSSPAVLAVFCLIVSGPLGWFANYPNASIGLLQGLVAFLPMAWVLSRCRVPEGAADPRLTSTELAHA